MQIFKYLILPVLLGVLLGVTIGLALAGCAQTQPYVTTTVVGEQQLNWFSDGPSLAITAHNPTAETASGYLACIGGEGVVRYPLTLSPHGEFRALGRVLNRDVFFDPCWWEPAPQP